MADDPITMILKGIAEQLQLDLVGTWSDTAPISGDWPIVLGDLPPTSARGIALNDFVLTTSPGLTDTLRAVNVKVRGDRGPSSARGKAHEIYLSLQGRRGALPNGALISQMWLQNEAQLGPDGNGRHERSVTYYVQANVAAPGAQ